MSFFNIIFFLLGSIGFSILLHDRFFKFKNKLFLFLTFILLLNLIILISYYISFYDFNNIFLLKFIFYFICLFSVITLFKFKKKEIKFNFNIDFIFLILFLFVLVLSLDLPPTDSDSLDYHLGAPKYWLENNGFSKNALWDTHYLVGSGEFLNFFGLYNKIQNINGIIQVTFIFLLLISLNDEKNILNSKNTIFILIIFSSPLVMPLLISQKPFLIPVLIFFSVFYCLENFNKLNNPKFDVKYLILIISALNFSLSSKYNFIFPFLVFEIYLFFKFRNKILIFLTTNLIFFVIISFPIYLKNFYFYGNPIAPFFEHIFSSNYLSYEKIKFSEYLQRYHSSYDNLPEYLSILLKIFIPQNLGSFFTIISPLVLLSFFIKYKKEDLILFLIFGTILLFNLVIGQLTARYYLIFFIPIVYLISLRFNFTFFYKLILIILCLPQLISITYLVINNYLIPKEEFLSKFVNEYSQIKWVEKNVNEKYITDLRMNYYSDNKINISLLKWSSDFSSEIKKLIKEKGINYAFISDNKKLETIFSKHFLSCGNYVKEIDLPYATRNHFNKMSSYKMRLIKINEKCLK